MAVEHHPFAHITKLVLTAEVAPGRRAWFVERYRALTGESVVQGPHFRIQTNKRGAEGRVYFDAPDDVAAWFRFAGYEVGSGTRRGCRYRIDKLALLWDLVAYGFRLGETDRQGEGGRHPALASRLDRVIRGDGVAVLAALPSESIDLILTDPPYGMDYQSGKWKGHYGKDGWKQIKKNIKPIAGDTTIIDFFADARRVLKPEGAIYVFSTASTIDQWKPLFEKHFQFRNLLVWVKNNHGMGSWKSAYRPKHELILYGDLGAHRLRQGSGDSDVLPFARVPDARRDHPTPKPVPLLEFLLSKSTDEGAIVLDPFLGTGATAVACVRKRRHFIGVELDPKYCAKAEGRIRRESGRPSSRGG